MLLDTYAPLQGVKKYKLKFKSKLLITLGLQKSLSVKNKLLAANLINKKDPIQTTTYIKIYSLSLWRKVNRFIMTGVLKKIGKILRTNGKELNPSFS